MSLPKQQLKEYFNDDPLGNVDANYVLEDNWGKGTNALISSSNDYILRYTIEELPNCVDAIWKKYESLGGNNGTLGTALDDRKRSNDTSGFYRQFENGTIFFSDNTCAHELHGPVLEKYIDAGGEAGPLGYPITDVNYFNDTDINGNNDYARFERGWIVYSPETNTSEIYGVYLDKWLGGNRERLGYPVEDPMTFKNQAAEFYGIQHFQNGSIYSLPPPFAPESIYVVHEPIYAKYLSLGEHRGKLGFPLNNTNGTRDGNGFYNHFEHGSIYSSPSTGSHAVYGNIMSEWLKNGAEDGCFGYPVEDTKEGYITIGTFEYGNITEYADGSIKSSILNSTSCY